MRQILGGGHTEPRGSDIEVQPLLSRVLPLTNQGSQEPLLLSRTFERPSEKLTLVLKPVCQLPQDLPTQGIGCCLSGGGMELQSPKALFQQGY